MFGIASGFSLNRFLLPRTASAAARRFLSSPRFSGTPTLYAASTMTESGGGATTPTPASSPEPPKFHSILNQETQGDWDRCWVEGVTPWDQGSPTPVILRLVETGDLPSGKALVPGCGSGYDVVAMASPERYVLGVDLSETAIKRALEWTAGLPNKEHFGFLVEDFFKWQKTEQFDLIFDYTFFCAIDLSMRPAWAEQIGNLLKPGGELITLMYPIDQHDGGPPFAVSVSAYEEVLGPLGFEVVTVVENELAIERRKGKEKLGRWKRNLPQANM